LAGAFHLAKAVLFGASTRGCVCAEGFEAGAPVISESDHDTTHKHVTGRLAGAFALPRCFGF
jgi:hypothetical protein